MRHRGTVFVSHLRRFDLLSLEVKCNFLPTLFATDSYVPGISLPLLLLCTRHKCGEQRMTGCSFHSIIMSHNYSAGCLHLPYALVQLSDPENVWCYQITLQQVIHLNQSSPIFRYLHNSTILPILELRLGFAVYPQLPHLFAWDCVALCIVGV